MGGRELLHPLIELSVELFLAGHRAVEPGMSEHLVESRSRRRIQLEHVRQQVLQVITERCDLLVDLPEGFRTIAGDQSVARISDLSLFEGLALRDHHEQNNRSREQIGMLAVEPTLGELLRSHVASGSSELGEVLFAAQRGRESKVSDSQSEVLVEQQVLRLQVRWHTSASLCI